LLAEVYLQQGKGPRAEQVLKQALEIENLTPRDRSQLAAALKRLRNQESQRTATATIDDRKGWHREGKCWGLDGDACLAQAVQEAVDQVGEFYIAANEKAPDGGKIRSDLEQLCQCLGAFLLSS
jgi:hypothetical protein